jgi:toxin ParE1/3/4
VEIAFYTATSQGSIDAARAFVWMLQDKFLLLADNPELGRVRDEIASVRTEHPPALRSFPVNKYVVFYEPVEGGVRIFRVLQMAFVWATVYDEPMPKKDWTSEFCKRCGKTPRADAAVYCTDCADTLALRGLLIPLPGQPAGEASAETDTGRTSHDKAP